MYANAQISGVFPDIVRTGSEVHFCRCPDTGLALASVPIRYAGKKLAQVIAKLLPLQLLRGVGQEQRQHVHLARKSLVEAVNADQIPDLYGSRVPCLQATMHGLPVATRPKIKMVPLQFTPFASDDTYHWQTTM
ncbi:pilus assembly protein [Escherichia coli]|uniref:pilus assembly protein n=4 Tax=Enterobacterales TaxID=91347 RepID=UPI003AB2B473